MTLTAPRKATAQRARGFLLQLPALIGALTGALCALPLVHADDTEIFYGQSVDAFENNPNILFVLDNSGSMNNTDGTNTSRMDRLKQAMSLLLDQSSSYNVGLMAFQGSNQGGAVRYPIGDLESDSDDLCPDGICPDEVVVSRPASAADDATQNEESNRVFLFAQSLSMATTTEAGAAVSSDVVDNDVTGMSIATSEVSEARNSDTGTFSRLVDRNTTQWFYQGAPNYEKQRYAYRFENVTIPSGATVQSAYVSFTRNSADNQVGAMSAYLTAESTADPEPYPEPTDVDENLIARFDVARRTNAQVAWEDIQTSGISDDEEDDDDDDDDTSEDVSADTINSPDIKDILTELASLPGWESGKAVSLLVAPFDEYTPSSDHIRQLHGSAATIGLRPVLHYSYNVATPSSAESISVKASKHADEVTEQNDGDVSQTRDGDKATLFFAGVENDPRQLGLLFENVGIPSTADILSARLTLHQTPDGGATATGLDADGNPLEMSINIKAELDSRPERYSRDSLSERTYTDNFVFWESVEDTPGEQLVSPDVTGVISEVLGLSTWQSGRDVALKLSAPASYDNVDGNIREIFTSDGTEDFRPELTISYDPNGGLGGTEDSTQTTAIRFANVHVPPGATVKSAKLLFHSHSAGDTETELVISAEDAGSSEPFAATDNNLNARTLTTAREIWEPEPWATVGTAHESVDISRVIQEVTDRPDWCGGNPLTVFLKGDGLREAVSYDQNPIKAPSLQITYEPDSVPAGSYCSNSALVVSLADSADDATENLTTGGLSVDGASLATNSSDAGTGNQQSIGLRFQGVQLPASAAIVSASLQLTSTRDINDDQSLTIRAEDSDSAVPYYSSNPISARPYTTTSVTWNSRGPIAAEEGTFSADISDLVKDVVGRPGWAPGNAMAFRIDGTSATVNRSFHSVSSDEALAPRLVIYYQAPRDSRGTRFRDNLKEASNELVAQGGTPIVDAYLEAALYFGGDPIDYGLKRGDQTQFNRYHRVSHPYSYTGGVVNRLPTCTDANLNALDCISEVIEPDAGAVPTYLTPIQNECQANHIVLLSDGEATSNSAAAKIRALTGASCSMADADPSDQACGRELAHWLATADHNDSIDGTQSVTTHTIGFNLSAPQFLQDIATHGGGSFYSANSAAELLSAFKNIFINVSKTDTSFVAPTATISQFNRLAHRDDIYFSLFRPEATARWPGNLKRFRLSTGGGGTPEILDASGSRAIDAATGEFLVNSRSFWSTLEDGGSVQLGGAAEQLGVGSPANSSRKVMTFTGVDTNLNNLVANELAPNNPNLDRDSFRLPPNLADNDAYYTEMVNWARGMDVFDDDGDGNRLETRSQLGDPLHSQPVLIDYGNETIVYMATNQGFVHAFEHDTGQERFAFIPESLLPNVRKFYENTPTLNRPYGLDGGMTTWLQDTNRNGVVDAGEKAYLYVGMRRGGNQYIALDVSNPDAPRYLWHITGGAETSDTSPTTADGDYTELASTWSRPIKSRVRDGDTERDVLIFGAGYDPTQDPLPATDSDTPPPDSVRSVDSIGRGIFIADARTGKLLWKTSLLDPQFNNMNYSIPSEVTVIDVNFDGLGDQLYVGDMGGQVWRLDINNDQRLSLPLDDRITGGRIAELAGDTAQTARRFYYPPDVAVISVEGEQQLTISIGSGWRAHPLDTVVEDAFFSLRSPHVYAPPLDSFGNIVYASPITMNSTGFVDVTDSLGATLSPGSPGWFMRMVGNGEKVLSSSVTLNHQVLFTSYIPTTNTSACAAAVGSGALYALNIYNGDPILDLSDSGSDVLTRTDRTRKLKHAGIPPATAVFFPEPGKAAVLVGAEVVNGTEQSEPERRTFWREQFSDNE